MTLHCKFYYLFKYRNIGRHVRFEDFRFPIFISHGSYRFLLKKNVLLAMVTSELLIFNYEAVV